ncbi:hypothetical protein J2795_003211 [Chryseobacterium bernardetii]|uniref:Uncharacterized protein n=1 Tax=Chryseobacterium bernardetii TaxID=1241978 RepID=A0ACC6IY83_9FLAO|nr:MULTISPECIES: DUF6361 family protein [Chryseobacterium]MDR6372131.1 hypothetical protein [Chryseobacterium vietnamense]MDR6442486.1 hypothetical protein [Chryseobacterium bernardetii]
MTQIGWIDFSTRDRERVKQIIERIRPEGQLDELGVGYLRDNISDLLFPGISTIQTRAKYFFIVPYILLGYIRYPKNKNAKSTLLSYLQDEEHKIKNLLRNKYVGQKNTRIIGITLSENKRVKRNPSEIYWTGLNTFGCINSQDFSNSQLSLKNYLSNIEKHQTTARSIVQDDESRDDTMNWEDSIFGIHVPAPAINWDDVDNISINLSTTEADFLKSQFVHFKNPLLQKSLIPSFVTNDNLLKLLFTCEDFQAFVVKALELDIAESLKTNLKTAYNFALIVEIAHLLYDDILQKKFHPNEYKKAFEAEATALILQLDNIIIDRSSFDLENIFKLSNRRIQSSELFIIEFWKLIQITNNQPIIELTPLVTLLKSREYQNKGRKSRLQQTKQYNSDILPNKRISLTKFQYRFYNVRTLFQDIQKAL